MVYKAIKSINILLVL